MNDNALTKHMEEDAKFQAKMDRVLFGDSETGEIGMNDKVNAMYDVMMKGRGIISLFGGTKNVVLFAVALGALIAYVRGWFHPM